MNRGQGVMLAAVLCVGAMVAQAKAKDEKGTWRDDERKARLVERLGLTEAQADKLEAAMKERKKAMRPLRRELRDAMLKLRDQVEDEAGDDAIKGTLERLKKAKRALVDEKDRFLTKVGEIVPPTQSAKLLLARGKLRMHAMGERRGRFMRARRLRRHEGRGEREGHGEHGGPGGHRGPRGDDHDDDRLKDSLHDEEEEEIVEERLEADDD